MAVELGQIQFTHCHGKWQHPITPKQCKCGPRVEVFKIIEEGLCQKRGKRCLVLASCTRPRWVHIAPGESLSFLNIEIDLLLQQLPLQIFTLQFRLLQVFARLNLQESHQLVAQLTEAPRAPSSAAVSLRSAKRLFLLNFLPEINWL